MKNIFLLAGVLTFLSACSDGTSPQPDEETQADSSPVAADATMEQAAITECPKALYSPLPDSAIHFDFPFQIARDRVYTSDAGVARRGLRIEYLDSDATQIWSRINEAMKSAGFTPAGEITEELKGNFSKRGIPTMFVSVNSAVAEDPSNPEAKGSTWTRSEERREGKECVSTC